MPTAHRALSALLACLALAQASGRGTASAPSPSPASDQDPCEGVLKSVRESVLGWDVSSLSSVLAAARFSAIKKAQACAKLGFQDAPANGGGSGPGVKPGSTLESLSMDLAAARACVISCRTEGCLGEYASLRSVSRMACGGLRMLGCTGGLPDVLKDSCDLFDPEAPVLGSYAAEGIFGIGAPPPSPAKGARGEGPGDGPIVPRGVSAALVSACFVAIFAVALISKRRIRPPWVPPSAAAASAPASAAMI